MPSSPIIVPCLHCGKPLDVSSLPPFSNAVCPFCEQCSRVNVDMGNYRILNKLGIGGMSVVYRAEDRVLNRIVALKVLNETYANHEDRVMAFEKEALVMAKVSHEHLVKIYGVGRAYGRFYIAMELVDGMDLESHIQTEGSYEEKTCLEYMQQAVLGLEAAWDAGLMHRDIKPANILVNQEGEVKIVDFGLALLQDEKQVEQEVWVTPYYAAPETLLRHDEDYRTDMYALGATMYHMLLGSPPLEKLPESSNELLELKRNIIPLADQAPDLLPITCSIVTKLLSFNKEGRFQDYQELRSAIECALAELDGIDGFTPTERAAHRAKLIRKLQHKKFYQKYYYISGAIAAFLVILLLIRCFQSSSEDTAPVVTPTQVNTQKQKETTLAKRQKISQDYLQIQSYLSEGKYHEAAKLSNHLASQSLCPLSMAVTCSIIEAYCLWISGQYQFGLDVLKQTQLRIANCKDLSEKNTAQIFKPLLNTLLESSQSGAISPSDNATSIQVLTLVGQMLQSWYGKSWPDYHHYEEELKKLVKSSHWEVQQAAQSWLNCLDPYTHDVNLLLEVLPREHADIQSLDEKLVHAKVLKDKLAYETIYQTPSFKFIERLDQIIVSLEDKRKAEIARIDYEKRAEASRIAALEEAKGREAREQLLRRQNRTAQEIFTTAMSKAKGGNNYDLAKDELIVGIKDTENLDKQIILSAYYDMVSMMADFIQSIETGIQSPKIKNKSFILNDGTKANLLSITDKGWIVATPKVKEQTIHITDIQFDSLKNLANDIKKVQVDAQVGAYHLLVFAYLTKALDEKKIQSVISRLDENLQKQWEQWMTAIATD